MPDVKISCAANTEDARWAAILGAEFLSVSLERGNRKKISAEKASEIAEMLPSYTGFIIEAGGYDEINKSEINSIKGDFIQVDPRDADPEDFREKISFPDKKLILDMRGRDECTDPSLWGAEYVTTGINSEFSKEILENLKRNFKMENTIVEGDLELEGIKDICGYLKPRCWSIKKAIEKSPRKIDYKKMKKYIREISLW